MTAIDEINILIKEGIVDVSENNPDSILIKVWGINNARYKNIRWGELVGRFLGGGIHESYGYDVHVGDTKYHFDDYLQSVEKFLEEIKKAG